MIGPPAGWSQLISTAFAPWSRTVGAPGSPGPAVVIASLGVLGLDVPPPGPFAVTLKVYDLVARRPSNSQWSSVTVAQAAEVTTMSEASCARAVTVYVSTGPPGGGGVHVTRTESSVTTSTDGVPGALGRLGTTGGVGFEYVSPAPLLAR